MSTLMTSMGKREVTAQSTPERTAGGRRTEGDREAAQGPARRSKSAGFGRGLRTQLEQKQGHGNLEERSIDQRGSSWAKDPTPL